MSSAAKPQTSEILQSLPTEAILAVGIADDDADDEDEDEDERPPSVCRPYL